MPELHSSPRAIPVQLVLVGEYLVKFSPLFGLGLGCYLGCLFIFFRVDPEAVRNVWLTNSYAPLIVLSAIGHWSFFTYLLAHPRRGALVSGVLTCALFLQLQGILNVTFLFFLVTVAIVSEVLIQAVFLFVKKLVSQRKQLPTEPRSVIEHSPRNTSGEVHISPDLLTSQTRRHGRRRQHRFFGK